MEYRIEMRLVPDPSLAETVPPLVVETRNGIENLAEESLKGRVLRSYRVLTGTFDEKVQKLLELQSRNDFFFSIQEPDAYFSVKPVEN